MAGPYCPEDPPPPPPSGVNVIVVSSTDLPVGVKPPSGTLGDGSETGGNGESGGSTWDGTVVVKDVSGNLADVINAGGKNSLSVNVQNTGDFPGGGGGGGTDFNISGIGGGGVVNNSLSSVIVDSSNNAVSTTSNALNVNVNNSSPIDVSFDTTPDVNIANSLSSVIVDSSNNAVSTTSNSLNVNVTNSTPLDVSFDTTPDVNIVNSPTVSVAAFPVTQDVNNTQLNGVSMAKNTGDATDGTQRVVLASDQPYPIDASTVSLDTTAVSDTQILAAPGASKAIVVWAATLTTYGGATTRKWAITDGNYSATTTGTSNNIFMGLCRSVPMTWAPTFPRGRQLTANTALKATLAGTGSDNLIGTITYTIVDV